MNSLTTSQRAAHQALADTVKLTDGCQRDNAMLRKKCILTHDAMVREKERLEPGAEEDLYTDPGSERVRAYQKACTIQIMADQVMGALGSIAEGL